MSKTETHRRPRGARTPVEVDDEARRVRGARLLAVEGLDVVHANDHDGRQRAVQHRLPAVLSPVGSRFFRGGGFVRIFATAARRRRAPRRAPRRACSRGDRWPRMIFARKPVPPTPVQCDDRRGRGCYRSACGCVRRHAGCAGSDGTRAVGVGGCAGEMVRTTFDIFWIVAER